MLSMGAYPPGVTDAMIDEYFASAECQYCKYFRDGICEKREDDLINELGADAVNNMNDADYLYAVGVDDDDCCDDYKAYED